MERQRIAPEASIEADDPMAGAIVVASDLKKELEEYQASGDRSGL
jgi:hypothetical protein